MDERIFEIQAFCTTGSASKPVETRDIAAPGANKTRQRQSARKQYMY